jgi:HEAT repeats
MRRAVWLFACSLLAADPQAVVRAVAIYDYGKDPAAVRELERLVHQPGAPMEKLLLNGLDIAKTLAAKDAFCRGLAIVGTQASVAKLEEMLKDPQTAEIARYALAAIRPIVTSRKMVTTARQAPSIDQLAGATERQQVWILAAITDRAVLREWAMKGGDGVRPVALTTLARVGTAGDLAFLADKAANTTGHEQAAARAALGSIPDPAFDGAILGAIPSAEPKIKVELIRAIGERGITSAQSVLLAAAGDSNRAVRTEAIRALRETAAAEEVPPLLDLLIKTSNETERRQIERAISSAIRRSPQMPGGAVLAAYQRTTENGVRTSLLNVMSSAGIPAALPLVRRALADGDGELQRAALNALSNWPTPEPLDDLAALTKSGDEARRVLALRGYIKLTQLPSSRTPAETARLLKNAFSAATQAAEKRTVLSIAQTLVCPESLELARAAVNDSQVQAEAKLATATLERALSFLKK